MHVDLDAGLYLHRSDQSRCLDGASLLPKKTRTRACEKAQ